MSHPCPSCSSSSSSLSIRDLLLFTSPPGSEIRPVETDAQDVQGRRRLLFDVLSEAMSILDEADPALDFYHQSQQQEQGGNLPTEEPVEGIHQELEDSGDSMRNPLYSGHSERNQRADD